jgi:hypothetical protein
MRYVLRDDVDRWDWANLRVVYGAWYADSGTADGCEAGFVEWPER